MKLSKILLVVSAAFSMMLSSCYDLDRYPDDQLSSGSFYQNDAHAKAAMMGVYHVMHWRDVYGIAFSLDHLGGIVAGFDPPSYRNVAAGTQPNNNGYYTNKWSYCYEGIARANDVLQNVNRLQESEEVKNRYLGEAKFMRALYYWHLLKFFGGVPLYDETWVIGSDFANMMEPRATEAETRNFILSDLETAIAYLPKSWDAADTGRATWGAAVSLKGKILLFNKQYKEASECFQQVINSGLYNLYPNYADLFTPTADNCSEMIFNIQNKGGVGNSLGMPMCFYMGTRASFGSCWNNVMASTSFADEYEWNDGAPFDWEEIFPGFWDSWSNVRSVLASKLNSKRNEVTEYTPYKDYLIDMYKNRDPRMNASLITPYSHYLGGDASIEMDYEFVVCSKSDLNGIPARCGLLRCQGGWSFYPWRKFVPEGIMGGQAVFNNREHTPINFPLIRYADVLLMQAECLNELGDQPGACALVNQVRARSNMPALNNGDEWMLATTKDEVFDRIRHERRIELAAEGHSFDDERRWGRLELLNNVREYTLYGDQNYKRVVTSRDYLWPIPPDEIDKNPLLKQNPGW